MASLTIIAALVAGLLSFFSPCVLPIIPGFLAYLSGTSLKSKKQERWKLFFNSLAFVLGFSVIFAILGVILNTVLQDISYQVQLWLSRIGGTVIIIFGLHLTGLLEIPLLDREFKFKVKKKFSFSYITSFLFGAAFAVGWTPCVGALLGSVLALAISEPGLSFVLLMVYALGLGFPFLIVGFFASEAVPLIQKLGPYLKYFNLIVGFLIIIIGILVFTMSLNLVANLDFINNIILS